MIVVRNKADEVLERLEKGEEIPVKDLKIVKDELFRLRKALSKIVTEPANAPRISLYALLGKSIDNIGSSDQLSIKVDKLYDLKEKMELAMNDASLSDKTRERARGAVMMLEAIMTYYGLPLVRNGPVAISEEMFYLEKIGVFFRKDGEVYFSDGSMVVTTFKEFLDGVGGCFNQVVKITVEPDE